MALTSVSVLMVQNEADILEYSLRANARLLDHQVLCVNPSSDRTLEIAYDLVRDGLALTVWQTNKNVYRQGEQLSWLLHQVRDRLRPAYTLLIDADEVILAPDRGSFHSALLSIAPGSVGALDWYKFFPDRDWKGTAFDPARFRTRTQKPHGCFSKLVVPAGTEINRQTPLRNGLHTVYGPTGEPLSLTHVQGVDLAHIPVRSQSQIEERIVAATLSKVIAEGEAWIARQESLHRTRAWQLVSQNRPGTLFDIALAYDDQPTARKNKEELVPDDRLPQVPLRFGLHAQQPEDQDRFRGLAKRLMFSVYPAEDPTHLLHVPNGSAQDTAGTDENPQNLPKGVFPASLHANRLYLDWPLFEFATKIFEPKNVLDIGCGLGAYLRLTAHQGARPFGIDGTAWSPAHQINETDYLCHDLGASAPPLDQVFDFSICVETLEHLPEPVGLEIVKALAAHTKDAILFSAAQPDQVGIGHITCRPHDFWIDAFESEGWIVDEPKTYAVRFLATFQWFRRNLYVLRPKGDATQPDLTALYDIGRHDHFWPVYGDQSILIGFPGAHRSFAFSNGGKTPPMPMYASDADDGDGSGLSRASLAKSGKRFARRAVRFVRVRGKRLLGLDA